MKTINVEVQEAKSTLRKKKVKKSTWYLIIKLLKMSDKEKNLKSDQRDKIHYHMENKDDSVCLVKNNEGQRLEE
jgi:hypothetical protein